MPHLFIQPDDRFLRSQWEHLFATFRIVVRDYRDVLQGVRGHRRHRGILVQLVSDLIDVEADLVRMGQESPADQLTGDVRGVWLAAAALAHELRLWRIPQDRMTVPQIEAALSRRKALEEWFNSLVQLFEDRDDPPVTPPPATP